MTPPFNVIFMGTPDFAVPSLTALHAFGCRVDLVVTQPDRPKGRGRQLSPPPVKTAAEALGYEVIQPEKINTDAFYEAILRRAPDLLVVVAFGHILPKRILEIPRLGPINLHASILPRYRGPAPIQWAIINGENETGITSMLMDKGLDTGEMLTVERTPIHPEDTAGSLHDRLALLSADVLVKTLKGFQAGDIRPIPQNHGDATYAPLLKKSDGQINWHHDAIRIERFIRGMTPWPGAFTFLENKRLKIYQTQPVALNQNAAPGTVIRSFPDELRVATGKDALTILEIQGASGKRMEIGEFLKGNPMEPGTVLS